MTREQIAPCPCGGKPFIRNETDEDGAYWSWVECGKCGLRTRGKWVSHRSNTCPMHYESVREQWNVIFSTATAILDAMPAPVWRDMDSAPKDGTVILVCLPRMMNLIVRAYYSRVYGYWKTDCETDGGITSPTFFNGEKDCWMHLPAPPTPHPEQPEPIREADVFEVGQAALENLLDRRGLREPLQGIKYDDPDIWEDICRASGEAALHALEGGG